jgi:hypothetical protein
MDFRTNRTRQALAMLGACFGLLLLASPANARSDLQSQLAGEESSDAFSRYLANHEAHDAQNAVTAQATVIPYLSHGEGVIVGENGLPESQPTVIPYLSHGIGVTSADSTATLRNQPDGFQPQLRGVSSVQVADDGFDWETTGFVTGGILAAMLLALMSTIALRDRRGLKSA